MNTAANIEALASGGQAPAVRQRKVRRVLPGFGLTLGFTVFYLSLIVLIPLAALVGKTLTLSWAGFWEAVSAPRVIASLQLSFGAALLAAMINAVFGLLVAWVLVRYKFTGKKIVDSLVDLPFALPTAVAGISLTAILASNGWVGQLFAPLGIDLAFNRTGIVIALIFIGLPFVVRTVQPVLEDTEKELEEAAACLGASRWQIFYRVIFPAISPALLTGFAMALARGVGEYGSIVFISSNIPMVSEIAPQVIIGKLDMHDYAGATAVAVLMLVISFVLLLLINGLQAWQRRRTGAGDR
ncbi:sulfate ABC transporter permease subunit CysT [Saezia sanguinis]|uniref:sulfate ABC transporter permease subunit CysT n=1 Tax=Saezia sanguinis TaxID=1965230 RepID=UPI003044C7B1